MEQRASAVLYSCWVIVYAKWLQVTKELVVAMERQDQRETRDKLDK